MTYHWLCNKNKTTYATSGTGATYSSEVPPRFFGGGSRWSIIVLPFGRLLFELYNLRLNASDYSFAVFKLVMHWRIFLNKQ